MSTLAPPVRPHAQLRAALGMFPTGVTLVTTIGAQGRPVGITVNSFNSISLDPPLVAFSLNNSSRSRAVFEECAHFAVHILAANQHALAQRFAARLENPFEKLRWTAGRGAVPLIDGAAAAFECSVRDRIAGGDHVIYLGHVDHFTYQLERPPLMFLGGRFCHSPQPVSEPKGSNA